MSTTTRAMWTTGYIKPVDLRFRDCVRIDGRWVEVLDVWKSPADFDPNGWSDERCAEVLDHLDGEGLYVVIRHLVEEGFRDGEDRIRVLRCADLVEIQTPVCGAP
ncbi:hypothetical protein [Streptomyces sp. NPDC085659]|uniref:hypothetical protein n=1 Tax=Streptomyces sp. NPDC085659 TaxID=3155177 RepID=UPI00344DC264